MKSRLIIGSLLALCTAPLHAKKESAPRAAKAPETPAEAQGETAPKPLKLSKSEAAAVEAYKQDMVGIQRWIHTYLEAAGDSPAKVERMSGRLSAELGKVRTTGLPPVLTKALSDLRKNLDDQMELVKDIPDSDPAAAKWLETQNTDPDFAKKRTQVMDQQAKTESALIDAGVLCGAGQESDLYQTTALSQFKERWIVILGAYKTFRSAKEDAQKVAKAAKIPFSMRGMVFDSKGLHLPDDSEDEIYAGEYFLRRTNDWSDDQKVMENHISVEISGEYEGLAPGYYIPVGYIAESAEEAEKKAGEFRKFAPNTYVKRTRLYMGCMH